MYLPSIRCTLSGSRHAAVADRDRTNIRHGHQTDRPWSAGAMSRLTWPVRRARDDSAGRWPLPFERVYFPARSTHSSPEDRTLMVLAALVRIRECSIPAFPAARLKMHWEKTWRCREDRDRNNFDQRAGVRHRPRSAGCKPSNRCRLPDLVPQGDRRDARCRRRTPRIGRTDLLARPAPRRPFVAGAAGAVARPKVTTAAPNATASRLIIGLVSGTHRPQSPMNTAAPPAIRTGQMTAAPNTP